MRRLLLVPALIYVLTGSLSSLAQSKTTGNVPPVVSPETAKAGTPATYKGRQLIVGSGGGATGFSTTYVLLDDGRLFGKRNRDTVFTSMGRQKATDTRRLFTTAETRCRIKTTRFDNPGNLYKFVQWQKGKQAYKVTWGDPGKSVPAAYPAFYDSFMALIPASARLR